MPSLHRAGVFDGPRTPRPTPQGALLGDPGVFFVHSKSYLAFLYRGLGGGPDLVMPPAPKYNAAGIGPGAWEAAVGALLHSPRRG